MSKKSDSQRQKKKEEKKRRREKRKSKKGENLYEEEYEDLILLSNLQNYGAEEMLEMYDSKKKYPPSACFECGKKLPENIVKTIEDAHLVGYLEMEKMGKIPTSQLGFMYFCETCLRKYEAE